MVNAKSFLGRSVWVYHINAGGCNGCDIEILDALTPRFDAERFGVKLVGSPKLADVILITGPANQQNKERIKNVYEQVPKPKAVVVIGVCGATGGVFAGGYNNLGGADRVIPVDFYVGGCPPKPEAILLGVLKAAGKIAKK